MKPKPLDSLNHLTVPVAIAVSYRKIECAGLDPVQSPKLTETPMFGLQDRVRHNQYERKLEPKHRAHDTPFQDRQQGFLRAAAGLKMHQHGADRPARTHVSLQCPCPFPSGDCHSSI